MTTHLVHIDEVEAVARAKGELQSTRALLGDAAGAREIGVSRWQVAPGMRSTPAHIHADEEEIAYVLGGSGLSWQDGKTYAVGPGDCITHRVNAEAHTYLAGDEGLDVLIFAEGSRTNITYLPRAGVFWLGAHWVPPDAPHPFAAELAAGPIERPAPEPERPATIVNLVERPAERDEHPGYEGDWRVLAPLAKSSGLKHVQLPPGSMSCPPHVHMAEEECFYVLEGGGELWLDDERHELRAGSFAVRPPGTRIAHALKAGPDGMTYLAYGHNYPHETVWYPRSRKLLCGGVRFRVEHLEYYDGEPDGA